MTADPLALLKDWITWEPGTPSGNLRPSTDILSPLRHTQLRVAGAPERDDLEDFTGSITMETGNLWHAHFEKLMRRKGVPVMLEVNLKGYLPEGWSGRPDWIIWNDEHRAFELWDLKTTKVEGLYRISTYGPKDNHVWQLSSYWHALNDMGMPMAPRFNLVYLPLGRDASVKGPLVVSMEPLDRDEVVGRMEERTVLVHDYVDSLTIGEGPRVVDDYLTDKLAPVEPRGQRANWNGLKFQFDVKLVPDWMAKYCPYPEELCDCWKQGETKIGHYYWDINKEGIAYEPRKDYEDVVPEPLNRVQIDRMTREVERAKKRAKP